MVRLKYILLYPCLMMGMDISDYFNPYIPFGDVEVYYPAEVENQYFFSGIQSQNKLTLYLPSRIKKSYYLYINMSSSLVSISNNFYNHENENDIEFNFDYETIQLGKSPYLPFEQLFDEYSYNVEDLYPKGSWYVCYKVSQNRRVKWSYVKKKYYSHKESIQRTKDFVDIGEKSEVFGFITFKFIHIEHSDIIKSWTEEHSIIKKKYYNKTNIKDCYQTIEELENVLYAQIKLKQKTNNYLKLFTIKKEGK